MNLTPVRLILALLFVVLSGCSDFVSEDETKDSATKTEQQVPHNSVDIDFEALQTVEDYVNLINSHSSSLSDPSTCQISDTNELSDELDIVTQEVANAQESGDADRLNLAVQNAELLFNRAFENCDAFIAISSIVENMFVTFPELKELDEGEISNLFIQARKEGACEEKCAASAVLGITIIQTAWVYAMITCAGTVIGYPICAGVATALKFLGLAKIGVDLASCLDNCTGGIVQRSIHAIRR